MAVDAGFTSAIRGGINTLITYHAGILQVAGLCLYVWTVKTSTDFYPVIPQILVAISLILLYPLWRIEEGKRLAEAEREREKLEAWWDNARERRRKRRPPISYRAFNNPEDSGEEDEDYRRDEEHGKVARTKAYQTAKKAFIVWRHNKREKGFPGPFRNTPLSMLEMQTEAGLEEFLRFVGDKHGDCKCGWDAGNMHETTYWNL